MDCGQNRMAADWNKFWSYESFAEAGKSFADSYFKSLDQFVRAIGDMRPVLPVVGPPEGCGVCTIPSPCWMPRCLGEVSSFVCPGGAASIRIQVTNCQPRASAIRVGFGKSEVQGEVSPGSLTLGPMERGWFRLTLRAPVDAGPGQRLETLVWVLGCNAHYLRWNLNVSKDGSDSCHEVRLDDCPDYVHHWYDHFYCDRPCTHTNARTSGFIQ